MALYRQRIDADPKPLEKLVRRFDRQQTFRLTGPEYARSKGQVSDLLRPWYQKKSFSLQWEAPLDERIFSPQLPQEILESFRELLPFYRYFTDLWRRSVPSGGSGRISISTGRRLVCRAFSALFAPFRLAVRSRSLPQYGVFLPAKPCLPFAH